MRDSAAFRFLGLEDALGKAMEGFFGAFLFGDIDGHAGDVMFAGGGGETEAQGEERAWFAIVAVKLVLSFEFGFRFNGVVIMVAHFGSDLIGPQVVVGLAFDMLGGEANETLEHRVGEDVAELRVFHPGEGGGVGHEGGEADDAA